jgi:hypothetical protein
MGNTCTSCNCNNQEGSELLTVENKVNVTINSVQQARKGVDQAVLMTP